MVFLPLLKEESKKEGRKGGRDEEKGENGERRERGRKEKPLVVNL